MSYLKVSEVSKRYDAGSLALEDFSLQVKRGGVVSMVGESGSGKSSLLRIIAGLEVQSAGVVHLGDQKILNPAQKLVPGYDEIQLIHQEYKLYPNSTVEENIARPLLLYDKAYQKERTAEILELLSLRAFKDKKPRQLSGGQQQKVAIGRALSIEPEVLLLDEPFSSLDAIQKRDLIEELKEIFDALEVTVIFVTHDVDDALLMSEELLIIQKGKLLQQGNVREVFRKPASAYVARLFGYLNLIPGAEEAYVRPSEVKITSKTSIKAEVVKQQFLIHYNLLTVKLEDSELFWKVDDPSRSVNVGDEVFLDYQKEQLIQF
ncbi:ABC transporter ATP-binding protein [Echinicola vietnamensis]|uniref:ABC-type spermidine/putrescine transport system, ATPase component n=1 Tax=Echinicola vietnamensis (strain DSM 17526 / LMG 23754 / KMM 6221) TaxID=926556 RepID=L0FWT6_ECHVK|nr:ABC transporter ATP-binding protein [Echinicola vietnamensis]AGA78374.1 ABC-type spermidine/putrescine transport system, ATPase component [Echinicola vietnamensis DSM 17526]